MLCIDICAVVTFVCFLRAMLLMMIPMILNQMNIYVYNSIWLTEQFENLLLGLERSEESKTCKQVQEWLGFEAKINLYYSIGC